MFRGKKQEEEAPKNEIFDVDLEQGIVTRRADGSRVLVLGSHGWATIENELASTFITGAAVILQRVGYSYGRAMGRAARRNEVGPDQVFDAMQTLAMESGWGRFTLNSGDIVGGQARVNVTDCFFCLHARESAEPVCHVLVGLVGGLVDEIIGGTHRLTENKCIAKGDAVCEIVIEKLA